MVEAARALAGAPRAAVCLVCDAAYAFPTAVVAGIAARMQSARLGPVFFVWADEDAPPEELSRYLSRAEVRLLRIPGGVLRPFAGVSAGHLTRGALARLFLAQAFEGEAVGRFVYLDADIEIAGALEPLAELPLPAGRIAAADDVRGVVLEKPHLAARLQAERRRLGMPDSAAYFNTGVLLADMHDWAGIAAEALKFYASDPEACVYLDQCAINAVAWARRLVLSPRWNFQSPFFDHGLESAIQPCVLHFTGPHKPWAPVPFTRSWPARRPFFAARAQLPTLWRLTAPRVRPPAYYTRALRKRFRSAAARERRRRELFAYLERTEFLDALPARSAAREAYASIR